MVQDSIRGLVGDVLDGTELQLTVDAYSLSENLEDGAVKIRCEVHDAQTGEKKVIEGSGVGIVDAFFHGMMDLYSDEYASLKTIRFADFAIKAHLDTGKVSAKSDSQAAVTLTVENSEGKSYSFSDTSPSITRSSISVVLHATEFFMNSERAFIAVYRALEHARAEKRQDSIQRYTAQLTTLVEATSYSEVIEQIRKSALGS